MTDEQWDKLEDKVHLWGFVILMIGCGIAAITTIALMINLMIFSLGVK